MRLIYTFLFVLFLSASPVAAQTGGTNGGWGEPSCRNMFRVLKTLCNPDSDATPFDRDDRRILWEQDSLLYHDCRRFAEFILWECVFF